MRIEGIEVQGSRFDASAEDLYALRSRRIDDLEQVRYLGTPDSVPLGGVDPLRVSLPQQADLISSPEPSTEAGQVQISPITYDRKVGPALCRPITGQVEGYPFEVPIPKGIAVSGVVRSDQVQNLDWKTRNADLICRLPWAVTTEVLRKLSTLVSIDEP